MPSELSSFFSRFRRPVRRQPTPDPEHASPTVQQEPSAQQSRIDRKILQDPSSLIDSEVQDAPPLGLTPSTRLHSAGPSPPGSSVDISPRAQSRFTISRISRVAVGSEWSTFGRKRERRAPDGDAPNASVLDTPEGTPHSLSPARDSKHLSANSTPSTFTLSRLTNPSRTSTGTHDRPPSPSTRSPQQSPDVRSSCKRSSPTDTTSSKLHPQTPQRPTSYTAPTSVTNLTTSVNRALALDSPHTFGHPTPPEKPVDFPVAYPSPPPPLPPLDHPELTAVFSSRTKTMSARRRTNSAFRDRSNTLPTNRRTPRKDDLFPSLSLALGRSLRHQSSLPQANQAFSTAMTEQHETRPPKELRRARTVSAGTRKRRMSADWSSYQATVGVNSHANQAWPAEVSREILRLSLLGPIPDGVPGSSELRGRNADPARRPDQGAAVSASFLPFPHPSRPNSPSPLRASATLTDGRETTPSRPHSLQFTLGNRTGSEKRARLSMADVKRSTSVIEARRIPKFHASGATNTPSGLGDPDPTSSDAPQAPHLSLAPTPSRSLFSGPTSFMQGEPSTPTPEPRHLSDKSRGKRKAEDNVDLTPPEQKKEGQRATFLLPSESRSQRVSNSSHAPSSYHRKRARLSSTSPFATPVQSRPASMQETPRSATRSHHFASLSSSTSARIAPRTPSRAASTHSRQPPTPSTTRKHERHQSMSQVSIPISAFISPHAPSISRSAKFHMRDPRKPPKKPSNTPWRLRFATEDEPGSAMQAWCFFLGFLLFPIWWIAGFFLHVPTTRIAGDVDAEKGVTIDDPQIEHDAKIWRFRCRVMSAVSLCTYVPFIVLVVIFTRR